MPTRCRIPAAYDAAYMLHQIEPTPDVTARLEWLDDLMFAAIDGDPVALEAAADAWHKTRRRTGRRGASKNRAANTCAVRKACGTRCGNSRITRRTKCSPRSRSSRCWPARAW